MSGTATTLPLLDEGAKEREYEALLRFLGIEEGGEEGLKKLRTVEVEKVVDVKAQGMMFFHPSADRAFFDRGVPTCFDEGRIVEGCDWVDEIVVGESFSEVCFF